MSGRRSTLAEIEYPVELGVFGDAGFPAGAVSATAEPLARRAVFLRGGAPDALPAEFAAVTLRHEGRLDENDPESWWVEAIVHGVDGGLTAHEAQRLVRARSTPTREVRLVASPERALALQRTADAARRQRAPWIGDDDYDGDYPGALWARDLGGAFGVFPLMISERDYPPYLPKLVAAKAPEGWLQRGHYLVAPFTASHPLPTLDRRPVRLDVYRAEAHEEERVVADEVVAGRRQPITALLIGTRRDVEAT